MLFCKPDMCSEIHIYMLTLQILSFTDSLISDNSIPLTVYPNVSIVLDMYTIYFLEFPQEQLTSQWKYRAQDPIYSWITHETAFSFTVELILLMPLYKSTT